ncbi:chitinase [Streptomyces griseofuscus]|uniref:chitinase n=1 Tax=Streptomyces TaxID=1883 RepID=UPI00081F1EFE|nr:MULTISPECIES: glycoside hydrolase family 18 protein [unclassified Streptomyces]MBJ7003139.1 glycoside hydrolase family 18 protein [Streptomyces sp. CRPSP2-6A1]MYQ90246.1 chitinase [Streptomyces sp. SID4946]SCF57422.1 chitinase family 18 [Streptomyces sp. LamerLS-31b]SCF59190.1 chitinase family 18 [Streptomyces sp. DconLS]
MDRAPGTPRPPRRRLAAWSAAVTLALATAGLAATAAPASAADVNNVVNAGFESGLSGWTCSAGSGTTVSSPVHSGTSALKATPAGQDNAQCTQTVAVKPNSSYTLSSWVQGGYTYLGVTGTGTTDVSTWTPDTTSWKQLSTSFTTGANTTSVTVYTHGWYGQAAYYADDVSLYGPDGGGTGGGTTPPTVPAAPTGLAVSATTSSSASLTWSTSSGATGYNVYENGAKVSSTTGTSATLTGLSAATSYSFQVTATNAAGESQKSAAVTATTASTGTGGNTGGSLPKHAVTGYWQNFNNGAKVQKISDVPAAYDIIAVAFADASTTPGAVTFTLDSADLGGYTADQFKADIKAKQAAGKKVIISIGGQNGTISVSDSTSATNFANSVYSLMQTYGFDGVDIDLENGLNATYMTQALRALSAKAGPSLIITMAPQTIDMQSTSASYFQTALNVKDILTVVNTQYYNSGSMLGCDGKVYSQGTVDFLTALACIQLQGGLSPSQIGLGLPASTSAAGSGYVSPSVVNNALDCLTAATNCGSFRPSKTYPDLRGAMTWSTNWDASNGNSWSGTVGAHVHAMP